MKIVKKPLSFFVSKMKKGEPFTLSRWGDGEWLTVLGFTELKNSNGCTFSKPLGNALRQVLKNRHPYYHSILKIAFKHQERKSMIDKWLTDNNIKTEWYNGDIILDAMLKGYIFPLVKEIRKRNVLYVGNERLRNINMRGLGFFPYRAYVQPPPTNAFEDKDRILDMVFNYIERYNIDFIGWSSGLAAKYFIDEVWQKYGDRVTQIDMGSSFDGFMPPLPHIASRTVRNTGSRSYIRKGNYDWEALRQVNTGERTRVKGETFKKNRGRK